MQRIDIYPTHHHGEFLLRAGRPYPFGATLVPGGINFAVFSRYASDCTLVLFKRGEDQPFGEIPFLDEFRIGNVFAMVVFDLDVEDIEYGYRMNGVYEPARGHLFDNGNVLLDPYAKAIGGRDVWGQPPKPNKVMQHRGRVLYDDFDWTGDRPLELPGEDLIIYEMHVRGFTQHPSSNVKYPGTFAAIREKIPYLKELGVNAIELMPIHEFDEFDSVFYDPVTGDKHKNYWGYSTVGFFAPKAGYAATGALGMQADELKALVKDLHKNGIEVFLDVVFNHTGEGGEDGNTISFRGLDNKTYYMLTPDGRYQNFSGCGNTMNCNNPVVRSLVLDCLRYWASEYHIDGFRFDLASIMGRDAQGHPLANPPLLEALAYDPILGKCKLIAEAWDAGGLYQVGSFPDYGRWSEWNDRYRDNVRRFLKSDSAQVGAMAQLVQGSPDLYGHRGPTSSINFIAAHDGFTLADVFAYNEKHNEANGENNRDGHNHNFSWNCGVEGPTDDPAVNALRQRQIKNAAAILMVSQGTPMFLMGDEVAHTKFGNNNTYCQDNELNWFDWTRLESSAETLNFFKQIIAFRKAHPALRRTRFFAHTDERGNGYPDISFHGTEAWNADWSDESRFLAFMLSGEQGPGQPADDFIYVAMNMHWQRQRVELPRLPLRQRWHLFANTFWAAPRDVAVPGREKALKNQDTLSMGPRSVVILVGR